MTNYQMMFPGFPFQDPYYESDEKVPQMLVVSFQTEVSKNFATLASELNILLITCQYNDTVQELAERAHKHLYVLQCSYQALVRNQPIPDTDTDLLVWNCAVVEVVSSNNLWRPHNATNDDDLVIGVLNAYVPLLGSVRDRKPILSSEFSVFENLVRFLDAFSTYAYEDTHKVEF